VNNAGIGYLMKPIVEMSIEEWDAVLGVNLRGAFLCTKYAAMQMIKQNGGGRAGGRIVNIASQAAKSGFPFASAYCSSKHGLTGLTRVTAIEMGKYGISLPIRCCKSARAAHVSPHTLRTLANLRLVLASLATFFNLSNQRSGI